AAPRRGCDRDGGGAVRNVVGPRHRCASWSACVGGGSPRRMGVCRSLARAEESRPDRPVGVGPQTPSRGRCGAEASAAPDAGGRVDAVVSRMMAVSRSAASAIAMAGPAVVATLMIVTFSGLELLGHTPFAVGPFRNIAEAAGMGAASEVLRLL